MAEGGPGSPQSAVNTISNALKDMRLLKPLDSATGTFNFKCGSETFALTQEQLAKIPYLEALCSGDFKEKPDEEGITSINPSICNPAYLKAVVKFVQTNRERRIFSSLPDTAKASEVFKLLDYLGVKKPTTTLAAIDKDLKNVTTETDKYGDGLTANRSKARDTCVILCWTGVGLVVDHKEQAKMYNLVLYIMSHPRTFYWSLRRLTLDWYLSNFEPTQKQITNLQGWFDRSDGMKFSYGVHSGESSSGGTSSSDCYGGSSDDDYYGGYSS